MTTEPDWETLARNLRDAAAQLGRNANGLHSVQIRSRSIDGVRYVRATDVADNLDANRVLPELARKLRGASS